MALNTTSAHTTWSSWYRAADASAPVRSAFEESLKRFRKTLAPKSSADTWIDGLKASRLQDVVDDVAKAQAQYKDKRGESKFQKRLTSFSKRVAYYGQVLDVMVQHHPEYVSLAWGTMKLVFGIVIEHEKLGSTILAALDDVGGTLSRIELAESLYPTDKMRDTIVTLNCHIMTFLCRAIDWYKMSSFSRTVQSITRPAALRYDDVIQDITKTMSKVTDLAAASSQAEQRDMHEELQSESRSQQNFRLTVLRLFEDMQQQLNSLAQQNTSGDLGAIHQQFRQITGVVHDIGSKQVSSEKLLLQEMVLMKQDLRATQVDIHHRLDEVQLDQAITFISSKCAFDHKLAYEHAVIRRKVHRVSAGKCAPFWDSRQLQKWDQASSHSSIILTSTFRDRLNIRDFYTGVIEQLIQSRVAVFWVIQEKHQSGRGYNVFEVLKSLVAQSLSKIPSPITDTRLSFRVQAFATATTITDHITLLAELLSKFQLVYIVVDTNALASDTIDDCRDALSNVVQLLRERSQDTVLKTMFIGYGSLRTSSAARTAPENVVRVAQTSKRKGKRVPQAPLRGKPRSLPKRETPVDTKNRWGRRPDGD